MKYPQKNITTKKSRFGSLFKKSLQKDKDSIITIPQASEIENYKEKLKEKDTIISELKSKFIKSDEDLHVYIALYATQ